MGVHGMSTLPDLYAAACVADDEYSAACLAAYGPSAYPDSRYYRHHTDAAVLAAAAAKHRADDALIAAMRKVGES